MKVSLGLTFAAAVCCTIATARSIEIEHAFGAGAKFTHRGSLDLLVDPSREIVPSASVLPVNLEEDASQLQDLIAAGGLYVVRIATDDSALGHVVAAIPACHLRLASFREELTLHVEWDGLLVGMDYKVPVGPLASTRDCKKMPVQNSSQIVTNVRVARAATAQSVPLQVMANSPPPGLMNLKESIAKQDTPATGNQSILVKYWYIFIPLVLSWMFSAGAPEPAGASASDSGVPASRTVGASNSR